MRKTRIFPQKQTSHIRFRKEAKLRTNNNFATGTAVV